MFFDCTGLMAGLVATVITKVLIVIQGEYYNVTLSLTIC